MQSEGRIERMEADGVLTADQAAMLRASLAGGGAAPTQGGRTRIRRSKLLWLAGGLAVLAGIAVWLLAGGSGVDQPAIQDVAATMNQAGGHGEMNKSLSAGLAITLLLVVPVLAWAWLHNSLLYGEIRRKPCGSVS